MAELTDAPLREPRFKPVERWVRPILTSIYSPFFYQQQAFKRKRRVKFFGFIRSTLRAWRALNSLETGFKKRSEKLVLVAARQCYYQIEYDLFFLCCIIVSFFIALRLLPDMAERFFDYDLNGLGRGVNLAIVAGIIISTINCLRIIMGGNRVTVGSFLDFTPSLFATYALLLVSIISSLVWANDKLLVTFYLFISTLSTAFLALFSYLASAIIGIFIDELPRFVGRNDSVLSMIYSLFNILWFLECDQNWRWTATDRAILMRKLDAAALLAGQGFFDRFQTRHQGVRQCRSDLAKRFEYSLRRKRIWLLTPKRDTRQILLSELSHLLTVVIEGDWDELNLHEQPTTQMVARRPYEYGIWFAKTVVISVLPLTVYLCLKHFGGMRVAMPFESYVQTGLIIWTLVSILAVIDPLVKDKIVSVRDILTMTLPDRK